MGLRPIAGGVWPISITIESIAGSKAGEERGLRRSRPAGPSRTRRTMPWLRSQKGRSVGSVDEDFAVESLAGDIMLLGNTSWRIKGVEMGKVRVEDAHGAPPNIPFWRGEAPSRTAELSAEVARLRSD